MPDTASTSTLDTTRIDDTRIRAVRPLITPALLQEWLPAPEATQDLVEGSRAAISRVLHGQDDRLVVVVGPCSIHDHDEALDYARRLKTEADRHTDELLLVMRVYFEKPRTTVGWKGYINDPRRDGSYAINDGLQMARRLLLEVLALGLPIGFKNGTDGGVRVALDAIVAAQSPHAFLGLTKMGQAAVFETRGNQDCHIILRGGKAPNYARTDVDAACALLASAGLREQLMIDVSHANSSKQHARQITVAQAVAEQVAAGDARIMGVMIESHLEEGRQDIVPGQPLKRGVSVTDACISFEQTVPVLAGLAEAVRARRQLRRN